MLQTHFELVLARRIKDLSETLSIKSGEYAKGADRLANFKGTAAMNGCTPEQALWGFVSKHIIATKDFIKDPASVTRKQLDEKIGDIMAYMVLLDGLFTERGI